MEVLCEDGYLAYDWQQARIFKRGATGDEEIITYPASKHFGPDLDEDGWISMATRQDNSTRSFLDTMEARRRATMQRREYGARSWRSSSPCASPIGTATPESGSPLRTAAWAFCPRPRGRSARGALRRRTDWYWPALMSQKPE